MRRVIIVQARVGSTRLPGKVLLDLAGSPMLAQQLRRLRRCRCVDDIVVATTDNEADDAVVSLANDEGVRWFRGSENDVLSRYLGAARESKADVIVRITADCPLIDPEVTDSVIREVEAHGEECDYASNVVKRTFPRGLDTEVFFRDTLERLDRLARSPSEREHVTLFVLSHPELFLIRSVADQQDNSDLRWTVDTPEDLALARRLYEELDLAATWVSYRDLLVHVRLNPFLAKINAHISQKVP